MTSPRATLSRWIQATPLRWHMRNKVSRVQLIQHAVNRLRARRYLEIGVADGQCFCAVQVAAKVGVDPVPPEPAVVRELGRPGVSYHALTSDDFFAQAAPTVLADGVDVVFIDGLHTDGQAYRDCVNALRYLAPGGLILMHDNLPISAAEACPAPSYDEAWRMNGQDWSGFWTGDGWKAILRVRALHDDARACVLDCDHGVGLVWAAPARREVALSSEQIDAMNYEDLAADAQRLLDVRLPIHIDEILDGCVERRN
jgi:hypothetical protein